LNNREAIIWFHITSTSVDANNMLAPNLVVNNGTEGDKTFGLRSIVDGRSIRGNIDDGIGQPRLLTISHGLRNPKDSKSARRHLVRYDRTKVDTEGNAETASVYIVFEQPQSQFDWATMSVMLDTVTAALLPDSRANLKAVLNGEP
jgi:hypothetical protein